MGKKESSPLPDYKKPPAPPKPPSKKSSMDEWLAKQVSNYTDKSLDYYQIGNEKKGEYYRGISEAFNIVKSKL